MKIYNSGNNESFAAGIIETNGKYLVITPTKSKEFKTISGAIKCAKKWNVYR